MIVKDPTYLYVINYQKDYKELCNLEMISIFQEQHIDRSFLTSKDIDLSRSVFLKGRITVTYMTNTLDEMEQQMEADELTYPDYKIRFLKYDEVDYISRLASLRQIGFSIIGDYAMKNYKTDLALTKLNGQWIFGIFEKDEYEWEIRKHKPYDYANALEIIQARSIVNIAIQNDFTKTVADVCCGIGTVVIEGKDLGVNIKGFELNALVAQHANSNLLHFGFDDDIVNMNMLDIDKAYDIAILDMPYGLFSLTTEEIQKDLIQKTRTIAKKAIIVSMGNMKQLIEESGFKIIESCTVFKSNALSRIISICE
jgi:predicted RNA methylase